jgi:virginiamycin B lyase
MVTAAPATAFHTPGSVASGIVTGPDGNLWAAIRFRGLYEVSVAGTVSEVSGISPEGPVTAGADGNIWADVETGFYPSIARISPAGAVAQFPPPIPAPTFGYETDGMATGPDGNVWFTSGSVNGSDEVIRVSRITPSGQVSEFPIPLSLAPGVSSTAQNELAPGAIAAGEGALWLLTERGIVRVTPEGQMTFLPVPSTQLNATGLAYGPDGNLWATYAALSPSLQVRRITPSGAVSSVPIPGAHTSGTLSVGITSGPDGNIWIADGARILRVEMSGAVTEFPAGLPAGDLAEAITAGPDGNLWFTAGSAIGRITTTGVVTVFPLPGATPPPAPTGKPLTPIRCIVPNLSHKALSQVKKLLKRAYCRLGRVTRPKTLTGHKLVVRRQRPRPKSDLPAASRVNVTLG